MEYLKEVHPSPAARFASGTGILHCGRCGSPGARYSCAGDKSSRCESSQGSKLNLLQTVPRWQGVQVVEAQGVEPDLLLNSNQISKTVDVLIEGNRRLLFSPGFFSLMKRFIKPSFI